ncbi:MAG TPA: NADH-quinone oxidoreductase subunit H, partial [Candidatus Desulfaltia sp.]|nr:NADH-quinone oxidoreductase subunit H [Candidatus Desulfaltia sp.]
MDAASTLISLALALATPLMGGVLSGIDRKLTARMQERVGPPLLQPFYDVIKLWAKKPMIASSLQPVLAFGYLGFALVAAGMVTFRQDLLLVLFVTAMADICLTVAAL